MTCPKCHRAIPARQLWRVGRYTFIKCPYCGAELGRGGGWQLYAVFLPMILGSILPLWLSREGYIAWSGALIFSAVWFATWFAIDVRTVVLLPTEQLAVRPLSSFAAHALQSWFVLSCLAPFSLMPLLELWLSNLFAGRTSGFGIVFVIANALAISAPSAAFFTFVRLRHWRKPVLLGALLWVCGFSYVAVSLIRR